MANPMKTMKPTMPDNMSGSATKATQDLAKKMKMHGTTSGTWHDDGALPQPGGSSMNQDTAVGSGSRPTKSMVKIDTSSPEDHHTQGRGVPGWLE